MPRSGTKLLRGLLGQHPRIRIPSYETEFLPLLARWVREHGEPASEPAFRELYSQLHHCPYFVFRERDRGPFDWRMWRNACAGRFDARGLFEGFVRAETGTVKGDGIIWGDKSPTYIEHLPLLIETFPEGKIVHLVRDVRDYCISIRKAWGKDVRRAASRWSEDVMRAHEYCSRMPGRFYEIRYESVLAAPEAELRQLAAFIGVAFTPDMLETARPVENLGDAQGHREIKRDNSGKFEAELDAGELEAIEALAWDGMHALGYAPVRARAPRRLSRAALAALRVKDGCALAWSGTRRRGLFHSLRFFTSHQRVSRR
jgi:hypothetical protein